MASVRRRHRARLAALALSAGAAATAGIVACSAGGHAGFSAGSVHNSLQAAYENVVRQVLPSVVEITAGSSTGSGVVYSTNGYIVTNAHVVSTAKNFDVYTSVLSKPLKARLVGVFAPDDIAVIKVNAKGSELKPARWADSGRVQVGDIVLAMGSPYGLADSVTQGIVSATGRTVTGPKIPDQPPTAISDAIQTSAAINPGNSGGALVMLSGQVLGIPTLSATDPELGTSAEGIGFAIPSDTVRDIANQLIRTGKVTKSGRASLDITGRTHVNERGEPDGVTVATTAQGGSAAKAGITAGDVIVAVDGQVITSLNRFEDVMLDYQPGQRVAVEVLRNGNPRKITATLGSLGS
jgi:putative serine protease PepD